ARDGSRRPAAAPRERRAARVRSRFEILVCGAGITGLTLAALLARSTVRERLAIAVADAGERPRFDPAADVGLRVSAIAAGSVRLLESLGVWRQVLAVRA